MASEKYEKSQPIDLIFCTSVSPQFLIRTLQYSCSNGKYKDVQLHLLILLDFENFVKKSNKN